MPRRSFVGLWAMAFAATGAFVSGPRPAAVSDPVTFAEDVAPIVFKRCTSCHRPGEAAPFALETYQDVKSRGRLIAAVTESRRMPPWKADVGDYAFKGERRLTDAEIVTIQRWVAGGMPEGDPTKLPPLPAFPKGWQLGAPDLVVKMDRPFPVPAYGPDIYRNFVLPLNLTEDTWVKAVDFHPSARAVVHHTLFLLDTTGTSRTLDSRDSLPGYGGAMGVGNLADLAGGRNGLAMLLGNGGLGAARGRGQRGGSRVDFDLLGRTIGGLGGWALGAQAHALPDGLAFFLPKGADLILSTHFHPSGKPENEASTVGLYFSSNPPTSRFMGILLPPLFGVFEGIDIPVGDSHYTISDSFVLPVDVKAFGVGAHAHYISKTMKLTATLPDGVEKTLLGIGDWDFAWQDQYQFEQFALLPKGTRLEGTISYDNSADNPRNPSHPPKRVWWGEQSTDEMGAMSLQVVAANNADMPALQQAYRQHLTQALMTRPGLRLFIQRLQSR